MSSFDISRRSFVDKALTLGGLAAAAGSVPLLGRQALAAGETVKAYGTTTAQLRDWSIMENSIGIKVEFTPTNTDIGIFMRDIISNDLGATQDIFIFDGGTENLLGPQGYYAEIIEDQPELTLWERTPDAWKRADWLRFDGK
ncbi:MAG: twin-arginine translocation signal domain-containing protein, partial [Geminicoccaceae bacterium]|nr:twin-arginine translocation signal domain-containing protein [Geminicoccaceae bacterium]